jgi:hypothetical protein
MTKAQVCFYVTSADFDFVLLPSNLGRAAEVEMDEIQHFLQSFPS